MPRYAWTQDWESGLLEWLKYHPTGSFNFSELPSYFYGIAEHCEREEIYGFENIYKECREVFENIEYEYEEEFGEKLSKKDIEEAWNEYYEKEYGDYWEKWWDKTFKINSPTD